MEPARKRIKLEEEPNPQRLPSPELSFKDQAATEPHCDSCIRIFRSKAELQRRNSKYHYNTFLCKACDEGFETRNQLNQVSTWILTSPFAHISSRSTKVHMVAINSFSVLAAIPGIILAQR